MDTLTDAEKETAIRYYISHKKSMRDYQQRNKNTAKDRNKKYLEKLKEDPERYKAYLEKKRDYYITTTKPKLEALKKTEEQTEVAVN